MTMRWPTGMSAMADPACSTTPAASCPRSIGTGRTRLPSTTDRSEWQRPAGFDADQQFGVAGRCEFELSDGDGLRFGVRPWPTDLFEHGAADPHGDQPAVTGDTAAMTSEQSLTSRDFPVHWPVHTRWTDNDMFGHLNNAVYYALFDTAINAWINTSCGIDPLTVPWLGVVAESGCKYLSELKFPDPLVVGLAATRLGNSSVTYRLAIFQEPDEAVAAVGHWVHVYVDRANRRPVPIPDPIRELLEKARVE